MTFCDLQNLKYLLSVLYRKNLFTLDMESEDSDLGGFTEEVTHKFLVNQAKN